MASPSIKVVDSLSLLSLKVAPNVFDLSSGMHHVSIRDQIVRAQLLVRDLLHADPELKGTGHHRCWCGGDVGRLDSL
nr:hypothetical protein [Pseudomonas sp. BIGb0427]